MEPRHGRGRGGLSAGAALTGAAAERFGRDAIPHLAAETAAFGALRHDDLLPDESTPVDRTTPLVSFAAPRRDCEGLLRAATPTRARKASHPSTGRTPGPAGSARGPTERHRTRAGVR